MATTKSAAKKPAAKKAPAKPVADGAAKRFIQRKTALAKTVAKAPAPATRPRARRAAKLKEEVKTEAKKVGEAANEAFDKVFTDREKSYKSYDEFFQEALEKAKKNSEAAMIGMRNERLEAIKKSHRKGLIQGALGMFAVSMVGGMIGDAVARRRNRG